MSFTGKFALLSSSAQELSFDVLSIAITMNIQHVESQTICLIFFYFFDGNVNSEVAVILTEYLKIKYRCDYKYNYMEIRIEREIKEEK